jgi:hypothetical protein
MPQNSEHWCKYYKHYTVRVLVLMVVSRQLLCFPDIYPAALQTWGAKGNHVFTCLTHSYAIALAVSGWLLIVVAQVWSHVRSRKICVGQSGTRVCFIWVLRFALPILIPQNAPYSSIMWSSTIGPLVPGMPSGLKVLPHAHQIKRTYSMINISWHYRRDRWHRSSQ